MAFEETPHWPPSKLPTDSSTQSLLPYSITGNIDADWYNLTENTVSRAKMEREELGKRIRQEIRDTVASIREKYAYQEYTIDDEPASFDSLEVLWDPTTQKISRSIIHLKQGAAKYEVPVSKNEKWDISLWNNKKWKVLSVEEWTGKSEQKVIHISTQVITSNNDHVREEWSALPLTKKSWDTGQEKINRSRPSQKLQSWGNMSKKKPWKVEKQKENAEEIESIKELTERYTEVWTKDVTKALWEKKDIIWSDSTYLFSGKDVNNIQYALMRHKDSPFWVIYDKPSGDGKYRIVYLYEKPLDTSLGLRVLSAIIVRDDDVIIKRLPENSSTPQKFIAPFRPVILAK